uniref:Uncharacterized protein n=1 Tax=Parascaris univalens TaxID=6257 RepID=A0A915A2P1_PARUN
YNNENGQGILQLRGQLNKEEQLLIYGYQLENMEAVVKMFVNSVTNLTNITSRKQPNEHKT